MKFNKILSDTISKLTFYDVEQILRIIIYFLLQTNTFQMVLATDEVFTYAIFNYLEINWSSHTEAGGDTTTGEGGVPAYVSPNFYSELINYK